MDLYSKTIYQNDETGTQYKITLSEFREKEYIHVRKYFLSYEGEWLATKEGAGFLASIQNTYALLEGLLDICSKIEGKEALFSMLEDKLNEIKNEQNP